MRRKRTAGGSSLCATRLAAPERGQLDELLHRPLKTEVYAGVKCLLDRCFHQRLVSENEKDDLEHLMARCTAVPGAGCAVSEASIVHRMMLAAFGIVPRGLDILAQASFRSAADRRDPAPADCDSEARTPRQRCGPSSIQHGKCRFGLERHWRASRLDSPPDLSRRCRRQEAHGRRYRAGRRARFRRFSEYREAPGNSVYTLAQETENGGNSGIDTIMRTLAEKRLIEDRAPTLDGSWMQRIMDARSANGNFLHSTMTPFSSSCGMSGVHGNLCSGGVARMGWRGQSDSSLFDKKLYLAAYYLGSRDLQADLAATRRYPGASQAQGNARRLVLHVAGQLGQRTDSIPKRYRRVDAELEQAQAMGLPCCRKTVARHGCGRRSRSSRRRYAGTGSCFRRARHSGIDGSFGYGRPRRRSPTMESPSVTWFPKRSMAGRSVPFGRATGSIWIWFTENYRSCGS